MDNNLNKEVPTKDVIIIFGSIAYLILTIIVFHGHSKLVGTIMFIPLGWMVVNEFRKVSKKEWNVIGERLDEQNKKPVFKFINYLFGTLQLLAICYIIYHFFTKT